LVHRILSEANYPIQSHCEYTIHDLDKAVHFMKETGGPCVVKPATGSGAGNGITTKISTYRRLKKASVWAATFSSRLLIEEEIAGDSFRLIYLGAKFLDAVVRKPPVIMGDGENSIKNLVTVENASRLKGNKITALSPLVIDLECQLCLTKMGIDIGYIPKIGEEVTLKTVCNQNTSRENESVVKYVHPSIIRYGEEISKLFRLDLVGVDIITPNISRALEETGGVVNEINTTPGIHHHYLINNPEEGVPVAGKIIEYILNRK
ncbi:MAG: cyanophycin synthetase, partial [bacterium]|nr:cyanophycin synthetase [bacterium]